MVPIYRDQKQIVRCLCASPTDIISEKSKASLSLIEAASGCNARQKSNGERGQPCHIPLLGGK